MYFGLVNLDFIKLDLGIDEYWVCGLYSNRGTKSDS